MTLLALDLNTTRVRALLGNSLADAGAPYLEGPRPELPLALNLEGRVPLIGSPGLGVCRRSPHLACVDFLPYLGQPREWTGPKVRLDAAQALVLVLQQVLMQTGMPRAVSLAIPSYLELHQRALLYQAAATARMPILGSVHAGLIAALAGYSDQPWSGLGYVVDVDGHALTWTAIMTDDRRAQVLASQSYPNLGLAAWKQRLLDAVADRCVRISRRDPRDSADAEQSLYDQLEGLFEASQSGGRAEVVIQTAQWSQHLVLGADELMTACASLVQRTLGGFEALHQLMIPHGRLAAVIMTSGAARLPGLTQTLQAWLDSRQVRSSESGSDFGEYLLREMEPPARLHVLPSGAVVRGLFQLSLRHAEGVFVGGHVEHAPLLSPQSVAEGSPRVQFQGRDYPLRGPIFTLGRHPNSDLVFDSAQYPSVSANHCEIVYDRFGYVLRDHSRYGTMINDRPVQVQYALQPGDWIRLGPGGPVLRFLGQPCAPEQIA